MPRWRTTSSQSVSRGASNTNSGARRRDEPGALDELVAELPGAPAGVAEEDAEAPRRRLRAPRAARRASARSARRPSRRLDLEVVGRAVAEQQPAVLGLHRPAPARRCARSARPRQSMPRLAQSCADREVGARGSARDRRCRPRRGRSAARRRGGSSDRGAAASRRGATGARSEPLTRGTVASAGWSGPPTQSRAAPDGSRRLRRARRELRGARCCCWASCSRRRAPRSSPRAPDDADSALLARLAAQALFACTALGGALLAGRRLLPRGLAPRAAALSARASSPCSRVGFVCVSHALSLVLALARAARRAGRSARSTASSRTTSGPVARSSRSLALGLAPAFGEELLFRGLDAAGARCRASARSGAILLSSLAFGAIHLDPVQSPAAFVLGLYLGAVVELGGGLLRLDPLPRAQQLARGARAAGRGREPPGGLGGSRGGALRGRCSRLFVLVARAARCRGAAGPAGGPDRSGCRLTHSCAARSTDGRPTGRSVAGTSSEARRMADGPSVLIVDDGELGDVREILRRARGRATRTCAAARCRRGSSRRSGCFVDDRAPRRGGRVAGPPRREGGPLKHRRRRRGLERAARRAAPQRLRLPRARRPCTARRCACCCCARSTPARNGAATRASSSAARSQCRVGLRRRNATLIELSRRGARLLATPALRRSARASRCELPRELAGEAAPGCAPRCVRVAGRRRAGARRSTSRRSPSSR